ncbi:tripartite-type tricarboxylate transporter receptor subunit TctC [Variovorax boronicumulans]|uniref:Tripartite-type tricarboxylate transporter receptor subunit TctC n=1 Tax=Variovorax boronicumulans TaxID=436515 RepID=A0AAW8DAK0_9BURK|nr:tripartite tricarboxylate transporter substrate binding protein [Variovorax boronicumulans]MDP9896791.1 tripartite-type tricarboxylate transporter receptor subunit TctC [Variovorax boronicumulans]MDP9993877.1 tripartite-type tricarboxylate transporter receptor subunit TctC [Variovorax boronicumulans]MDQ0005260.1 tripartite-type tricarboxylate transporter receptor subunit TctC [Variovorax boronicumulans]MDQ0036661.1 tripartite-type tricarboxylate transporter receptor subunit TctC [Variovorax 
MHFPVRTTAALALLGLAAVVPFAQAQDNYPTKPIRLVVGFPAGGPTDVVARAFGEFAARALGQPVVVDNKPGANTILAAEAVASAPPDGYTLLLGALNHTMIPALYSNRVKFDALRSFAPVCSMAVSPTVLVVGPSMPVKTLSEFLAAARAKPGERTYATPGSGSGGHFASEQFNRLAGTRMNHIPYKGAAQAVTDLMGGQVDSSFATLGSVLAQVQSGKLRALAVASPQRSPLLPDVPTFEESGVKGYSADAWYGLLAPAGTPAEIVAKLTKASADFARAPATADKLRGLGMQPQHTCGGAFTAQLDGEIKAATKTARELDLKLD